MLEEFKKYGPWALYTVIAAVAHAMIFYGLYTKWPWVAWCVVGILLWVDLQLLDRGKS